MLPTDVLDQPNTLFWMNAQIRMATNMFERDLQKRANAGHTDAGVASPSEKRELVEDNDARADRREDLDGGQVGIQEQLEAMGGR